MADPLGEEPQLRSDTWHAVNAANRAVARLDQASRQVPAPHLLLSPTLRREAQSTSALEGTYAPIEDVLAAEASPDEPQSRELTEVLNYIQAADAAFDWVRHHPRLTVGLLTQVHEILVEGTPSENVDAGRIRRTPVVIGSRTGSIEDSRFVPMPAGTALEAAVQEMVDWINDSNATRDPLVAAAMAHYQFETLHPFNDGNGRIGRLLIVLQMMQAGLIEQPLLSVSPWFELRRENYQDHLSEVSASGDWDAWIQFFARGVEESAIDTALRVNRLLAIQQRYVERLQSLGPRLGVVRDIAEGLIGSPLVTIPELSRRYRRTYQAVNTAVLKLVDLGILTGPFGTYNRLFAAQDVIRLLQAPMGMVPEPDAPLSFDR